MYYEKAALFDWLMNAIGLGEFYGDMQFVIKVFAFILVVNFVRARVGFGLLSSFLTMFLSYYVIFENWNLFGPITIMYLVLLFGFVHIIQDFFFVSRDISMEVDRLSGKMEKQMHEQGMMQQERPEIRRRLGGFS